MTSIADLRGPAVSQKDDAAEIWLRSIHEKHSSSLFRYALALTCSVDDAQDAVQEVFARISSERRRMMEVQNVQAYLFRATRNAAFSILRKRKRCEALHDAICTDLAAVCMPHAKPVSATIISIREAFSLLTSDQREVLVLRILNQLTFREIAETVGVSINTVSARYRYGVDRLRHVLGVDSIGE